MESGARHRGAALPATRSSWPVRLKMVCSCEARRLASRSSGANAAGISPRFFARSLTSGADATDEAALAERIGHPVRLVEGEATNIKITGPRISRSPKRSHKRARYRDTAIAEAGADRTSRDGLRPSPSAPGRPLVIGGVTFASDPRRPGTPDADVVCHAITDAMLGAACLGDMGGIFPT